jgi:sialate O-acetylesterase
MVVNRIKTICFFASWLFAALFQANAEIKLPALIADNMVIQQQSSVKLWGNATANKTVTIKVSWTKKVFKTTSDDNGSWLITFNSPKAGGPYNIAFSDGKVMEIKNVMFGEVWLCSGQSNMEMPMKGYFGGQLVSDTQNDIAKADPELPIRIFKVEKKNSLTPLNDINASWQVNNPLNVKEVSAAAYYYALYLQSVLKVPVGIITSSWGGSSIEAWMDSTSLAQTRKVVLNNDNPKINPNHRHCQLYNGMIYPLKNYAIKGVLWYQGEANSAEWNLYKKEFPAMVAHWRKLWGLGEFPFYYAQIAPWKYDGVNRTQSARFREMQQSLKTIVPNSDMVATVDTGDSLIIHPIQKRLIGERFAYTALNKTYKREGTEYRAPQYKSMTITNDTVIVSFDFVPDGFYSKTKPIPGFEIAGSDKAFKPANVILTNKSTIIKLTEPSISQPVAVRYAFKNYTPVSLFNNLGFPLMPFRSDDWSD